MRRLKCEQKLFFLDALRSTHQISHVVFFKQNQDLTSPSARLESEKGTPPSYMHPQPALQTLFHASGTKVQNRSQ